MKKLLSYLFLFLWVGQPTIANNDFGIIGTEPTVLPDWKATVYPNPNNGVFSIMVNGSSTSLQILVFNVIGEKVFEQSFLGHLGAKIDLSHLIEGIYIVQVIDENHSEVRTMRMQIQ